jgi:hypothetical protein
LKLNSTHQLLVYTDHVNILGGSLHTINKNVEALAGASKKTGLEGNADRAKYEACHESKPIGNFLMLIVATLPSTLILYL